MLWEVKAARQPLMVDTHTHSLLSFFIYIIVIIFSPMTVHMMRLLSHRRVASRLAAAQHSRRSVKSICLQDESATLAGGMTALHADDIELISEMLQNGLVDVCHET